MTCNCFALSATSATPFSAIFNETMLDRIMNRLIGYIHFRAQDISTSNLICYNSSNRRMYMATT